MVDDLKNAARRREARGGLHAQPRRQARHARRRRPAHDHGHPRAAQGRCGPSKLYGCEVWRDLDWLIDEDKVVFDVEAHENLAAALLGVFDSQICGGKRYDLATHGPQARERDLLRLARHGRLHGLTFAMDLTPLIEDDSLDPTEYVNGFIKRSRTRSPAA